MSGERKAQIAWAVVSGEYSDYRIHAVFERREDAEAAEVAGLGDDIHEIDYCPAGVLPTKVMVHEYWAMAHPEGKLADCPVHTRGGEAVFDFGDGTAAPKRPVIHEGSRSPGCAIYVEARCASAALAEKALRDRLARLYAEWAGVADG